MKHDELRAMFAKFDAQVGDLLTKARLAGEKIPCKEGCWWCCLEPVYCSKQEAELLADRVRGMPHKEMKRIKALVAETARRFMTTGLQKQEMPSVFHYRAFRFPCPLLKDGKCSVYEDRPFGCRGHIARRTSDGCERDDLRPTQEFLDVMASVEDPSVVIMRNEQTEMDHLILLLHEALNGERLVSSARLTVLFEDGP